MSAVGIVACVLNAVAAVVWAFWLIEVHRRGKRAKEWREGRGEPDRLREYSRATDSGLWQRLGGRGRPPRSSSEGPQFLQGGDPKAKSRLAEHWQADSKSRKRPSYYLRPVLQVLVIAAALAGALGVMVAAAFNMFGLQLLWLVLLSFVPAATVVAAVGAFLVRLREKRERLRVER